MWHVRSPSLLCAARSFSTMHVTADPAARSALGCVVYISEGRDAMALRQLEDVAREACRAAGGVALASLFVDAPYHRSNFCLVGRGPAQLAAAAAQLSRAALSLLDLRAHEATHPRLGVVDHISCHPLASAALLPSSLPGPSDPQGALQPAVGLARAIAQQLGAGEAAVPVYLYAAAHPQQQSLADIRRALGYFRGASQGQWAGPVAGPSLLPPGPLPLRPDYGPAEAPAGAGVCCVGASPWVVNFNVLLEGVADFGAARRIARAVSERGGGLRSVQAMALHHTEGVEMACNLLDHQTSPPEAVEARIQELAEAVGGRVRRSYRIGRSPEELLALAQQL